MFRLTNFELKLSGQIQRMVIFECSLLRIQRPIMCKFSFLEIGEFLFAPHEY